MNRVFLCLATQKGHEVLRAAIDLRLARSFYVCTFREAHVLDSFDERITRLAVEAGIPVVRWEEVRENCVEFLRAKSIAAVLCSGWRYLIPPEAIQYLRGEVIIAHDSLLPKYRGFAPLPTALIAGERQSGVTFLRAGPGVDDGDILWQKEIAIGPEDTIADLIAKVLPLYVEGACRYLKGELREGRPQDDNLATYSIWRDPADYRIDWSESAERIERTIRGLGPPYLGAQCQLKGQPVVIHGALVLPDIPFAIRQPGKVWNVDDGGRPTVVCGEKLLKITSASSKDGSILPLKSLRQRFS